MATSKKSANVSNAQESLNALRETLQNMVDNGLMSQELMDKQLATAETGMKAPARDKIGEAMEKAVKQALSSKEITDAFKIVNNGGFKVQITVKDGELNLIKVSQQSTKGKTALSGGKRPTIICNGESYPTYAALCAAYGEDPGKDSARRYWERLNANDPDKFPAADEVESDD